MTTLPPAQVKKFSDDTLEKKIYNAVEELAQYLPIQNDRYRLGYNLYKQFIGEGDTTEVIVRTNRFAINGITKEDLVKLIDEKMSAIKK